MKVSNQRILTALVLLLSVFHFPVSVRSQVRPVYDYGANGLGQLLKRLQTTKSVLMIGAHPDDEDSALLAFLARGENARTAYLSLTRGDGGQNVIGSELFESLGVIRTEELLQARRLDGAEQFFTRAFDFGFTKTLAETKQKWDERVILCDAVRVIRQFRPLVVISRFAGTTADGHGQHQYAGYISPLAVKAAAAANQCKDAGAPWQVLKFYVEQGFRSTEQPTLKINTGVYDFLLGRSYYEIAAEGRSLHETQEQGGLELKGAQFSGLNLAESKVAKIEGEQSVFDGIDVSLKSVSPEADKAARQILREFDADNLQKIAPILAEGLRAIRKAGDKQKEFEFSEAMRRAGGITIDALADKETVAPDESFTSSVKVFFPKSDDIKVKEITLKAPNDWAITKIDAPKENAQAFRRETANEANYFNVKISPNAAATQPYWIKNDRIGDLFAWQPDENQTLPFQLPLASAEVKIEIVGTEITLVQPVQYRYADGVRGEVRRELNVVPRVSLNFNQNLTIVSGAEKSHDRELVLSVTNNSSAPINDAAAKLDLPDGWQAAAYPKTFSLKNKGDKTSIKFLVTVPRNYKPDNYEIAARVEANGEAFTKAMNTIVYPHIQTHRFYTDARAKVGLFDLKIAPLKVGYIMGSGDEVAEAIRRMGLTVDLLNESDLQSGELQKYDAIVVGIRAYQVRGDLIANNQRVLDYVKNGGNLIVQYQRPDYAAQNLQPFPASMTDTQKTTAGTTARVVDENAKVTILQPQSPAFNRPNKITGKDFDGWVQERNLYNFTTFDAAYTPLLEAHDAGELENKGGMMLAKIGKGNYIYTSYSFFRQLPAGVPGAYRIFANLLALPKNNEREISAK